MLRVSLFSFCLLVAANSSQAEVGFFHRKVAQWETATEGQRPALLHLPIVIAQADRSVPPIRTYTMREGYEAGKKSAFQNADNGSFLSGCACGFLTGLIGTAILWKVTDGDEPPFYLTMDFQDKGPDYATGFKEGYKEQRKGDKRKARLLGGFVGTALSLMLFFSITN